MDVVDAKEDEIINGQNGFVYSETNAILEFLRQKLHLLDHPRHDLKEFVAHIFRCYSLWTF